MGYPGLTQHSDKFTHADKWTFYFVVIGIITGLGAITFHYLCHVGVHYFMDMITGIVHPNLPRRIIFFCSPIVLSTGVCCFFSLLSEAF